MAVIVQISDEEIAMGPHSTATSDPLAALRDVIATVKKLRAPDGCPWDREQTHHSLRRYLIEETYEALEVLDQIPPEKPLTSGDPRAAQLEEELGDVLLQILLHAEMASETGALNISSIAARLNHKLITRHPHVFANQPVASNADEALQRWEKQKLEEKKKADPDSKSPVSVLTGIPLALPALQKTERTIEKVTQVGFQWPNLEGPLEKIEEEWAELKAEIPQSDLNTPIKNLKKTLPAQTKARISSELGDVLFSLVNFGYLLGIPTETALRETLTRFEKRFRFVEDQLRALGKSPEDSTLGEMDQFWNEAKKQESLNK